MINLSPKTIIDLDVSYKGKAVRLSFDTSEVKYQMAMSLVADKIKGLGIIYKTSTGDDLEKKKNEICVELTDIFKGLSEDFKTLIGDDNILLVDVWLEIVVEISRKTQENTITNDIMNTIKDEDEKAVVV